jgi:hypothetical protein
MALYRCKKCDEDCDPCFFFVDNESDIGLPEYCPFHKTAKADFVEVR